MAFSGRTVNEICGGRWATWIAFPLLAMGGAACGNDSASSSTMPGPVDEVPANPGGPAALLLATGQSLAAGTSHTCAVLEGGAVKCWGLNDHGQLGLESTVDRGGSPATIGNNLPYVKLGRSAKAIASKLSHTCVILDNDQVKCWGLNDHGQIGFPGVDVGAHAGDMGDRLPTVSLGSGRTARAVVTGYAHTCAILDNGQVKCWGSNDLGTLGLGDRIDRGSTPGDMGDALPSVFLGAGRTALALAAGGDYTCAILDNGTVKCWGGNANGQLGLESSTTWGQTSAQMRSLPTVNLGTGLTAKAITSSGYGTCVILNTNAVKCWGDVSGGQQGQVDTFPHGLLSGSMGDNLLPVDLGTGNSAASIAGGGMHYCVRLQSNDVKCWGFNFFGSLGLNDNNNRGGSPGQMGNALPTVLLGRPAQAVVVGNFQSCAVLDNRLAKCWGRNDKGQLGLGDMVDRGLHANEMQSLPVVGIGRRSSKLVANGGYHACALLINGTVKCWGRNDFGQLGQADAIPRGDGAGEMGENLPFVPLGTGLTVGALAAGHYFTCALFTNGKVKCWGYNADGELGLGDTNNRGVNPGQMGDSLPFVDLGSGLTATGIYAGAYHTCAILSNGAVKCWGFNGLGELGLGDTNNRGSGAGQMGDSLLPVSLGAGFAAASISGAYYHTCALSTNGQVKCWGFNGNGECGLGDKNNRGVAPGQMGDSLPAVGLGPGLTAIELSVGGYHSCARLTGNQVKCWGYNGHGELGQGDNVSRGGAPNEVANLPVINIGASMWPTALSVGGFSSCALLNTGGVKCWGYNLGGTLGLGDTNDRGVNPGEMGDQLPTVPLGDRAVIRIAMSGDSSVCATLDTNQIKCWGQNIFGELGLGDTNHRGDVPHELGDILPVLDLGPDVQDSQ